MCEIGTISTYESGEDLVVEWKIDFFPVLDEDGHIYYSPDFSFRGAKWCLGIAPNGWSGRDSLGYVDLDLGIRSDSNRTIRQSYSFWLKTANGEKCNEQHYTRDFDDENYCHEHIRFISRSEIESRSDLVQGWYDVLTVVCTMKSSTSAESDSDACASGPSASLEESSL